MDSFVELQQAGVSGGAIVNGEGKLVGNLVRCCWFGFLLLSHFFFSLFQSRVDLKGTQGGTGFGALNQSIMHYQRKHRVALAQRLVTVAPTATLAEVISTMSRERVHRVFVVEGGMVPRGLVTQTDICRVLGGEWSRKQAAKTMKKHAKIVLDFPLLFPPRKN